MAAKPMPSGAAPTEGATATDDAPEAGIRVDKWLWHARFFKTRTLAAKRVSEGKVRVNKVKISKPSRLVRGGDVLTFAQGREVRVVEIAAIGTRRGPAPEAAALYRDLDPPKAGSKADTANPEAKSSLQAAPAQNSFPATGKFVGKGRPTKKDRRKMRLSRDGLLD